MATVTLRPNSDINVGHNKYENGSTSRVTNAYTLIDDVTSDEAATTIGQSHHSTNVTSKTSTFGLGGSTYNHKIFINSIKIYNDYWCNNPATKGNMSSIAISVAVYAGGTKSTAIKTTISNVDTGSDSGSWKTINREFTPSNFNALNKAYDSLTAANIQFDITTEWKCGSSSVTQDQYMYVSQVYAVVDYTDAYTFTAIGNETTDVVSPGDVKDGTTVYFNATPVINHRFVGWYSDASLINLVSNNASYSVTVHGADMTLYANSKRIEAINIYYKSDGAWKLVNNLYIKENGAYKTITAQDLGNYLYFSDRSYLKLK